MAADPRFADLLTPEQRGKLTRPFHEPLDAVNRAERIRCGELLDADEAARDEVARVLGAVDTEGRQLDGDMVEVLPATRAPWWVSSALATLGTAEEQQRALDALATVREYVARLVVSPPLLFLMPGPDPSAIDADSAALDRLATLFEAARGARAAAEDDLAARGQRWTTTGAESVPGSAGGRPRRVLRDDVHRLLTRFGDEIHGAQSDSRALLRRALAPYHAGEQLTDEALKAAIENARRQDRVKPRPASAKPRPGSA